MLVRAWIVHSTLHKFNVLFNVLLHLVETNMFCWDFANLEKAIELLQVDEAILGSVNIAKSKGPGTKEFTLFT